VHFVANFEKRKEQRGSQMEEPILVKAKKARVLRIQDEIDRSSEPLIGEQLWQLLPCLFKHSQ